MGLTFRGGDVYAGLMLRHNFATGYGAREVELSFSLSSRLFFHIQYFNGYGHTLLDYNVSQSRIGIGIMLNR